MNARDCYLLGAAVQAFDPKGQRLTLGCTDKVCTTPQFAPAHLRHVWAEMQQHPRCRELLASVTFSGHTSVADAGSFWIGYYQERSGEGLRAVNPTAWAILHPEAAACA